MRKVFPVFLALVFLAGLSAAQVSYSIETGPEKVEINSTIRLSCDQTSRCPVNQWSIPSWPLPENADIENIRDSQGKIEDYTVEGDTLSFETNTGPKRTSETVQINMMVDENSESIYRGLEKRSFSLPGVSGKTTSGTIQVGNLISGRSSFGFSSSYSEDRMNFTGKGPVNVRIKFGEGNETKYYEFFGRKDIKNSELAYEVSVGMTGKVQGFQRFPVSVMDSKTFNETVGKWSAGEYIGGSIKNRQSLEPVDKAAVLAHETVHGLNDREFRWDQTGSSYIDEGTGKFVEFLVRKKLDEDRNIPNLFGEDKTYTEMRDGKRYRITVPSRGSREQLWNYYQNDIDIMKSWNPSRYPEWRSFGYAYSDLIIRNYVVNMNGSLKGLYGGINPEKEVSSNERKWQLYSQVLDLTPCEHNDREKFNRCLDRINNHRYSLTRATEINRGESRIMVEQIDIKEKTSSEKNKETQGSTKNSNSTGMKEEKNPGSFLERLADFLETLLQNIFGKK